MTLATITFQDIAQAVGTLVIAMVVVGLVYFGIRRGSRTAKEIVKHRANKRTAELARAEEGKRWLKGNKSLQEGEELLKNQNFGDALECFDVAVEFGAGKWAFRHRAMCLQERGFNLEAIDDFDRAIQVEPENSNLYFMRSLSRGSVGDLHGAVADLHEAIRVSGINNAAQRSHDAGAREWGYASVHDFYLDRLKFAEMDVEMQFEDEEMNRTHPDHDFGPDLATQRRQRSKRRNEP